MIVGMNNLQAGISDDGIAHAGSPNFKRAIWFDGSQMVSRQVSNFRSSDSVGSFLAWIWVDGLDVIPNQTIFSANSSSNIYYFFRVVIDCVTKSVRINFENTGGISSILDVVNCVTEKTWVHCAVVGNGSTWAVFINGIPMSLTIRQGANSGYWLGNIPNINRISAGRALDNGYKRPFYGTLRDECLYNRVLSQAEVQQSMITPIADGRVVYWPGTGDISQGWRDNENGYDLSIDTSPLKFCYIKGNGAVVTQ